MLSAPIDTLRSFHRLFVQIACLVVVATIAVAQTGCLGVANLMHAVGMDMIPAEYEGLEDVTLAIVTITDSSQYSNDIAARDLSRRVGGVLTKEVKKVKLVREDLIEQWRDTNGWEAIDFQDIGKGVDAEKVLAIELSGLQLRDGATLYRGRANVTLRVIDVASGNTVYTRTIDDYTFPTSTGQHTSETTESRFRKLYLSMLATEIGRSFHPYDMHDRVAIDSEIASH